MNPSDNPTTNPTELEKAIERIRANINFAAQENAPLFTFRVSDIKLLYSAYDSAAKRVPQLEAALRQEKIWKEEDPRMLREQMRVHDVAYQHLFEKNKKLEKDLQIATEAYQRELSEGEQAFRALANERDQLLADARVMVQKVIKVHTSILAKDCEDSGPMASVSTETKLLSEAISTSTAQRISKGKQ